MKLSFILITILLNIFYPSLINSEEKIDSINNKIRNISKEKLLNNDKYEIETIHIVKEGDTITNISKLYSINKNSIIKLNYLKDENYIYIGQNLIISNKNKNSLTKKTFNYNEANSYHIIQTGENLTEISNKYRLKLDYLISINNIKNPDSIKVGEKLFLNKNDAFNSQNSLMIKNQKNEEFLNLDKKTYGPLIIQSKTFKKVNGRKIINVLNKKNEKLILSISCKRKQIDVRIPGRKWRGFESPKEEFEKNIINDLCKYF